MRAPLAFDQTVQVGLPYLDKLSVRPQGGNDLVFKPASELVPEATRL
jgi:hypothetical protein